MVICAALSASSAFAGTVPANVAVLVYQDAGWASGKLRSHGYTLVSSNHYKGKNVEYWWGNGQNLCLRASEVDDKYESITTTSSTDCNQYHEEATKGNQAAGVAVAAAALLGVAMLASKSHERNDKHNQDAKSTAEFDRGYRDGLHHQEYHNYNNTGAYSEGYNEGQVQRREQTRHHSNNGYHSGYNPYVSLDDLVGEKASGADNELQRRGFDDVGGYKQGEKSIVTWWNPRTRQCVNTITKNGRIKRIESLNEGNCI